MGRVVLGQVLCGVSYLRTSCSARNKISVLDVNNEVKGSVMATLLTCCNLFFVVVVEVSRPS